MSIRYCVEILEKVSIPAELTGKAPSSEDYYHSLYRTKGTKDGHSTLAEGTRLALQ